MTTDAFDAAVAAIYAGFVRVKDRVEGRPDSQIRRPERLVGLMRDLDLLPPPARCIRITGSKGKGTTARRCADRLAASRPGERIGLFVSPEEFEPNDRIRVDGVPIPREAFVRLWRQVEPHVAVLSASLEEDEYLSPFGLFLIVALMWFREQGVAWTVLECGRGAAFDEVGVIASRVAVVTSILFEHPTALGPTLDDIADSKLAIGRQAERLLISESARAFASRIPSGPAVTWVRGERSTQADLPRWLLDSDALAREAVAALLDIPPAAVADPASLSSASFGRTRRGGVEVIYEAAINLDSLDTDFVAALARRPDLRMLVSLTDDKDRGPLTAVLRGFGTAYREVALTGARGFLRYDEALATGAETIGLEDVEALDALVRATAPVEGPVYFVGTQNFIRLVRRWLRTEA